MRTIDTGQTRQDGCVPPRGKDSPTRDPAIGQAAWAVAVIAVQIVARSALVLT